ncbi:phosphomethylpyrimidine synthase ThiC [Bacillota bacterium LX-D]|nr:phosphomethylpyrimidine synthase ThiC [Bacillota bacterium LX-D]
MTQIESAVQGIITVEMEQVAKDENVSPEFIRAGVAAGTIVIPCNINRTNRKPTGIGAGLRTKVSASVGLYGSTCDPNTELAKIKAAVHAKTDSIMDLSVSGDIDAMRKESLLATPTPVGTLPLYQAMAEAAAKYGSSLEMKEEELLEVIERQAADGVDFLAMHCGLTREVMELAKSEGRVDPLVSYGGSHLIGWMVHTGKENPLYTYYDRILEICRKYDVTISLADGMRPGAIADSLDWPQVKEMSILGDLVRRARKAGVQIMVKGPGHVPVDQIKSTINLQKTLCQGAPYFVFGPLVTDITPGYDHYNAAIGGALSAWSGADFICYVTASEHLGLPDVEEVHEGVIIARIAAHAGDVAKGVPGADQWDLAMSKARKLLDWKKQFALAVDPERAEKIWKERSGDFSSECTMCGKYCAMKVVSEFLHTAKVSC